jgi:Transposase DDE domain
VTPEGFPVAYEVFEGDTADVTTLEEIVSKIENKYGMKGRVWVFDRGVVSEDNLQDLRQRGAYYLVGTPRRKLADFERELLEGDWQEIAGKPGLRVQLLCEGAETFVLARSLQRAKKESAMLRNQLVRLHRSLRGFRPCCRRRTAQGHKQNRASPWSARRALSPSLVDAQRSRTSQGQPVVVLE